ncbi:MAG: hypothetical protein J5621_02460 [Paludibacteraceae bacterium]|nr:hypothetical protein [Paludibacteraceae bacterium]
MKTKRFFALMFVALLYSCISSYQASVDARYVFQIFRYTDEANKELIITTPDPFVNPGSPATFASGIINFPKRYRDEPYFFYESERWEQNPEKYIFDICELATEEKLLALHDHYYTYFPYTGLRQCDKDVVRDGKWSDLCSTDPLTLPVVTSANSLYSEIRMFEIRTLEKLTKKKRDEMTIDDIEKAVNKVIDEGKLDKYSVKVDTFWASWK